VDPGDVDTVVGDMPPGPAEAAPPHDAPEFLSWLHRRLRALYPVRPTDTALNVASDTLNRLCDVLNGACLPKVLRGWGGGGCKVCVCGGGGRV
jgi:hypothetical protein